MRKTETMEKEACFLQALASVEDLAEKKTKIYSRLLMDAALAKEMEELSLRHQERRDALKTLLSGEEKKKGKKEESEE